MGVDEFWDQIARLALLVWTQVWFVAVMGFFVALVRFLMRKMMMNWMNPMRLDLESHVRVSLLLVLLEVVVDFGNQMPNPVPLGVVWRQPWYPSVVVHQLACGWQFVPQQPWISLRDPHIWIQP